MTTTLEKLQQEEKKLQADLTKLQADRESAFAALSAQERPTDAGALAVATLAVKIQILQGKLLDARVATKAEVDRLESPEVKKAIKDVTRLEAELDAGKIKASGMLKTALDELTAMKQINDKLPDLLAKSGVVIDPYSVNYDERSIWIRQMLSFLQAIQFQQK